MRLFSIFFPFFIALNLYASSYENRLTEVSHMRVRTPQREGLFRNPLEMMGYLCGGA